MLRAHADTLADQAELSVAIPERHDDGSADSATSNVAVLTDKMPAV